MSVTEDYCLAECASRLMRVALIASHEGRLMGPAVLREKFTSFWNHLNLKEGQTPPDEGEYWEGPKASRSVAKRIFEFLSKYKVLQPDAPYSLVVGGYTIQGRYAIVRRSKATPALVLSYPAKEPLFKASPDMCSLARLYHARNLHYEYKDMGLIYLPLLRGDLWLHRSIDERLVKTWLESAVANLSGRPQYPVPGNYCVACSKPCLKVFP